jgi:signal transduction histidine kinase
MNFLSLSRDRILTWTVPVLLTFMLIALAVLQYRWSRQVSEAASTRMQTRLQNSMMNFRLDLARELATMCLALQGDNASLLDARGLDERVEAWQRTSSLSGLIVNVYEWNQQPGVDSPLLRLSQPQPHFQTMAAWPADLDAVHELLLLNGFKAFAGTGNALAVDNAKRKREASPSRKNIDRVIIGAIDESVPLLMVPSTRRGESVWLLVELDPAVLQDRLFPQLSDRYFGDSRSSDYEVAVIAFQRNGSRVLFSSGGGFGENAQTKIDASLNLFGPPLLRSSATQPSLNSVQPAAEVSPHADSSLAATAPALGFYKIRFDPIGTNGRSWQIVVKHRSGSVAAAVASLRYRDLKISFGALLVLAASVALIVFNSQRARHLAMLQMEFVAGVSHELRTPVAAILSISENIVDGVVEDEKQLLRYGGMIRTQARRLHHLVEQVLRFAAIQRRTTSYTIRQLKIADVIDEVLENMAILITASGFTVERMIDPHLPMVRADFGVLSQCLENLISNAVKYGGESKWIGIQATLSDEEAKEPMINVTVEDHGIGVDPQELRYIFEPFYRSPKVLESQVHGTGLGLALAKNFARTMGGGLTVASKPGKGSAFTIHIPAVSHFDLQVERTPAADVIEVSDSASK